MASGQRRFEVLLLLFFMVASSVSVPTTRSFKTVKNQVLFGKVYSEVVSMTNKHGGLLKMKAFVEGRMNLELEDYTGTGANDSHDYP
ncbi:hypothetical protein OROGR_013800 [Orobanche gracilis]